jgi:hypothetical protein
LEDTVTLEPIPETWTRALAVVAHPDDLEYGAASAIARWTASGRSIGYVIVTDGEAGIDAIPPTEAAVLRQKEQLASAKIVGVDDVSFLHYRDGVVEYGLALLARDERSASSTPSPSAAFNSRGSNSRCSTSIAPPFAAARPTPTRMRCVLRAPHPNDDGLRSLLSRPR